MAKNTSYFLNASDAIHTIARDLLDIASKLNEREEASESLDEISRAASTILQVVEGELWSRAGRKPRRWSTQKNDPFYQAEHPLTWKHNAGGGLADHPVKYKSWGKQVFEGHPYHISGNMILVLADLIREGWDISIDGRSDYFPGRTARITYSRQEDRTPEEIDEDYQHVLEDVYKPGPLTDWLREQKSKDPL